MKITGLKSGLGVIMAVSVLSGVVLGQEVSQREKILDEPFRVKMDEQVPSAKRAVFDWGGWLRSSVWYGDDHGDRDFDGRDDSHRVLWRQQLRVWGQGSIDQVHRFYVRGRLDMRDWNSNTSFDGNDSDWDGPKLDRFWYDFRWSRACNVYDWQETPFDFSARLGRQYMVIGTGLAMSQPLDAARLGFEYQQWQVTGLIGQSTDDDFNIDQSMPGAAEESRIFWGTEVRYRGWRNHEPFAYFLSQDDKDAGKVRNGQMYGYDSSYLGLGSRGQFFHRDLQYTTELAYEQGKSFAWGGGNNREDIQAWAGDFELRYLVPDKRRSQLWLEYLISSGDGDRSFSPTNTIGGNQAHTTDDSFSAWGYRNTGLALAPRLSNLGMVKLGGSTFPAMNSQLLKELQVGSDIFVYHKQQKETVISDSLSADNSAYVGTGMDIFADWRILSDVAFSARYGIFWPGSAYVDKGNRHQFFTAVTVNF